jgi:hypothetical protein
VTVPRTLYKYEAFSTQSLLNLKRQIIHFGSPLKFNDPYDCALTPNIVDPSDEDLESVRRAYLSRSDLPDRARIEFQTYDSSTLRGALIRAARSAFASSVQKFLNTKRVACFSERNDDQLMWSHYGGHYKGFCLAFDTSTEPFQKINQVRYVRTLPQLSLASILLDRDFHPVLELFCTKSESWAYEKEWRAIHNVVGTQFGYPSAGLSGVFFGPDIDRQSLEIVCLILIGQNGSVRFWQGARSTTEFRVTFEPFTYTSHIDASAKAS